MPDGRHDEEQTVPIVEETLSVGKKRIVTGTVRLHKRVHEEDRKIDVPVIDEDVVVHRVPIDRWVDHPVEVRQEGDTTVIPVLEEVVVIEKRLKLIEEVRVTKRPVERRAEGTVTVRREDVVVERQPAAPPPDTPGPEA